MTCFVFSNTTYFLKKNLFPNKKNAFFFDILNVYIVLWCCHFDLYHWLLPNNEFNRLFFIFILKWAFNLLPLFKIAAVSWNIRQASSNAHRRYSSYSPFSIFLKMTVNKMYEWPEKELKNRMFCQLSWNVLSLKQQKKCTVYDACKKTTDKIYQLWMKITLYKNSTKDAPIPDLSPIPSLNPNILTSANKANVDQWCSGDLKGDMLLFLDNLLILVKLWPNQWEFKINKTLVCFAIPKFNIINFVETWEKGKLNYMKVLK